MGTALIDFRLLVTCCRESKTMVRFSLLISHKGNRTRSVEKYPSFLRHAFTGTGLGSIKRSRNSGYSEWWKLEAVFRSPDKADLTSSVTSVGNRFDATDMTPSAPDAIKGNVRPSSPLRTVISSPSDCYKSTTRHTSPPESLICRI